VGFYPFRGPDASLTLGHDSTPSSRPIPSSNVAPNRHVEERDG
jgi:hypothetical protein